MSFAEWIGQVVAWRRELAASGDGTAGLAAARQAAIAAGLAESRRAAVAAVGDIAMPECPLAAYHHVPEIDVVALLELLGAAEHRIGPLIELANEHIASFSTGGNVRPGLSPHATYSVHPELLRRACALSAEKEIPIAMHVAESQQELQLLASHSGPLVDLLGKHGAWFPASIPRGARPLDYLEALQNAHRALVIHGNYLADEEIEFLAARRDRMSVVYCPRTHAYFGHDPYPLAKMLREHVRVVVGTDSRASNPDLSILAELRHIAQHRHVAPGEILKMGTLWGAEALGIDSDYGSITAGKRAQFAVVPVLKLREDPQKQVLELEMPAFPWPPIQAPRS